MIHKIIIFLFLFISGGAIISIGTATYFYVLFLVILSGCFLLSRKKIRASSPTLRNIFILAVVFAVLMVIRGESLAFEDNGTILLKFVILIIFSIYVTTFFDTNELFFTKLVSVFEFLLKLSLLTFVLSNLFPKLLLNVGAKNLLSGEQFNTFFGMAYGRSGDFTKYKFYRNQSIFWEPGVYCVIITTVYIIKVFYLKQKKQIFWYVLTIITTFSMGGVTIFLLLVVAKFFLSGSDKQFTEKLPALALLVGIPLFAIVDFVYSYSTDIELIIGAIFQRNLKSDTSVNTRYQDFYYGFLASKNNIWFGHGQNFSDYYKVTSQAINSSKESYNGGITNSVISILYCYGIFYLVLYLAFIFQSVKTLTSNSRYALLVLFAFIGLQMLEPLHFAIFILFVFIFRDGKKTTLA